MITTVTQSIAWAYARCKWCDRPQPFKVQGGSGLMVRFTCSNRRCSLDNEVTLG